MNGSGLMFHQNQRPLRHHRHLKKDQFMKPRYQLTGEIRYALRLTERTARFYRNIQTVGVFISIIGGSAAVASAVGGVPVVITVIGGILLATSGAALIAIRPADKAAKNEVDVARYRSLMARSVGMNDSALEKALEEAHADDTQEIESLRDIAYNDMVREIGREDEKIELSKFQIFLERLA